MAAAAFHIGGYTARAFSLFAGDLAQLNLASYERSLVHLMRRDVASLRQRSSSWLNAVDNSDAGIAQRLQEHEAFTVDDALAIALTRTFHKATGAFEAALMVGDLRLLQTAAGLIERGLAEAAEACHVPLWWSFFVAKHLFDDLWHHSLHVVVPVDGGPDDWPVLRSRFIQLMSARPIAEIDLWPSQLDAASRVIDTADDLVVALPTSAGKTRIAELCILRTLANNQRVVYVTPLRALSAQVESGLARTFCPLGFSVSSVYGASGVAVADLDTLKSGKVVVATPEKLDFAIRQEPTIINDVGLIVLDEGHMIGLSEREIRYEMLVQRLLRRSDAAQRRLVCLSAVFADGDAFDDFTTWIRADAPGAAVRSTWRPTRQRPGTLQWHSSGGRLELSVEGETPFVPRFVEPEQPKGRRKRSFPAEVQELIVAATTAFLKRGQSVLVYCPIKSSVEATAQAFLKAHEQGYFTTALSAGHTSLIADALRVGHEWLGATHPAVRSLSLGIAVHHGSLPRPFLSEVETLLKQKVLSVCISSPTLAQGLDLCFSVLIFRSLWRNRSLIPAKEFANVIGRVGRAFVDLDGIYVLPILEGAANKARQRAREFLSLIEAAGQRQLESGVRLLIELIVRVLRERLSLTDDTLVEYVLNQQSSWTVSATGSEDTYPTGLALALNELDTAILGIVDALEMPIDQLGNYVDQCLQSSYWQRRLRRTDPALKRIHEAVIRGRAQWLWSRTDINRRRGFFAAGVGFEAGKAIDDHASALASLLQSAEEAFGEDNVEQGLQAIIAIAKVLFEIKPFAPEELVTNWEQCLSHWITGAPMSEYHDPDAMGFIQNDVVYRLVWGVEAARVHLHHITGSDEVPGGMLALFLTYGVPDRQAALFLQAGLNSRRLAYQAARKTGQVFSDLTDLGMWIATIRSGEIADLDWSDAADLAAWTAFVRRFEHHEHAWWQQIDESVQVTWRTTTLAPGSVVRLVRTPESGGASVLDASFMRVGDATYPVSVHSDHCFGTVSHDSQAVDVSMYGLSRPPPWISD
ncbi:MAG: DEAD/DEAH box helicase [Phycisphaerae bacterium]|nr:DEAD/DEAH box helicase [Phycisphaerae bacterium]